MQGYSVIRGYVLDAKFANTEQAESRVGHVQPTTARLVIRCVTGVWAAKCVCTVSCRPAVTPLSPQKDKGNGRSGNVDKLEFFWIKVCLVSVRLQKPAKKSNAVRRRDLAEAV